MRKFLLFLTVVIFCAACAKRERIETITVASERALNENVMGQECFLVKHDAENEWNLWCFNIEGFEYQPGYEYVLQIKEKSDPEKLGVKEYALVKEVSKILKESEKMPEHLLKKASDEIRKVGDELNEELNEITEENVIQINETF